VGSLDCAGATKVDARPRRRSRRRRRRSRARADHRPADASSSPSAPRIAVALTGCGTGWLKPAAGEQNFLLVNTDLRDGSAQLINPANGAVYADVEPLGSGASAHLRIVLGHGSYA
jgi:iron uptake system component EfeO